MNTTPTQPGGRWRRRDWLAAGAGVAGLAAGLGCTQSASDDAHGGAASAGPAAAPAPRAAAVDPARDASGGWVAPDAERGHALRGSAPPRLEPGATARRVDVLVIGAGIAGLACARALRRGGLDDLAVLELADHAGGNSRGHRMGGTDCPLGAHYLPVPGEDQATLVEFLEEVGLSRRVHGRREWDERHLVHAPAERLFVAGAWHEGLVPPPAAWPGATGEALRRQLQALAAALRETVHRATTEARRHPGMPGPAFTLPSRQAAWTAVHDELDAMAFSHWLDARGLDHPALRWYLDYACLDDYGADAKRVSAWAGVHYFASRSGDADLAVGLDGEAVPADPVLTWPEGNAWLARRLAEPLGDRLATGRVVNAVRHGTAGVEVDAWHVGDGRPERWSAREVVLAVPLFSAHRLLAGQAGPWRAPLDAAVKRLAYAPWLVANLQLDRPLADRIGAPPAWDNVVFGERALGYVDATHQRLAPVVVPGDGAPVITAYLALGGRDADADRAARRALLQEPWTAWRDRVLAPLAAAHPDLARKVVRADLMRLGHAMAIPEPGVRSLPALAALTTQPGPVRFAHSDLAGYSVFEEAFAAGHQAGEAVLRAAASGRRRPVG